MAQAQQAQQAQQAAMRAAQQAMAQDSETVDFPKKKLSLLEGII